MHRDLKPENILFHYGKIKIADFGFAKIIDSVIKDFKMKQTLLGTPYYCAPQILQNEPYSYKCDIWSLGCIFYECLYGKVPFIAQNEVILVEIINKGVEYPNDVSITSGTKELLKKMLSIGELRRPDWEKIVSDPCMKF